MAEPGRTMTTADAFMAFDGEGDTRYELIDGVVVAMAPATDRHGAIVANAIVEIATHLHGRPPCVALAEAGIRLDDRNHYKADVAATCAPLAGTAWVEAPFLIVEVLSESTRAHDLGVKVPHYIELPSVQETWLVTLPLAGDAGFASTALDASVTLDALYRNTAL